MSENAKKFTGDAVKKEEGGLWETIKVIIQALLIALVVRTLLFQPFNIPSGSLIPTLLIGDYLFVSKYSYGYSKHSIPFSPPLVRGPHLGREPKRGDIAVFKLPKDNSTDYIKRVIGLPGDKIQVIAGILHINGKPVKRERVEDYKTTDLDGRTVAVPRYRRPCPNGVSHFVIEREGDRGYWDNTEVYTVPARAFLHDGRQPRQLRPTLATRQCRLGALREFRRPRRDHLLLDRRERVALAVMGMAGSRFAGTACSTGSGKAVTRRKRDPRRARATLGLRLHGPGAARRGADPCERPQDGKGKSYQRLEFLGDRVLGLAIAEMLFDGFPDAPEGELSRRLAELVRTRELRRGRRRPGMSALISGSARARSTAGERRNQTILADVCEAIIGAVFLDGGL